MTDVKQQLIQRKFPTPVQFVIACPGFWQTSPDGMIKWHYDTLFQRYRSWAQSEGIDARFMGKDWTILLEPLKILGILPHLENKGRICIDKRRFKGFSILTADLVKNINTFLKKAGQDDDDSNFEPPKASFAIQSDCWTKENSEQPHVSIL